MPDVDVFAALANPTRREVLRMLREDGPHPVNRLAERFDMRRPSFSEHLRLLKDVGLVSERRAGRERIYSLRAEPLRELSSWLAPYETFWQSRLSNLSDFLDGEEAASVLDGDRAASVLDGESGGSLPDDGVVASFPDGEDAASSVGDGEAASGRTSGDASDGFSGGGAHG